MVEKAVVGKEGVALTSDINTLAEGAGENTPLKPKENFEQRPHPADFDLATRRRALIAMRVQFGADTRPGHVCSDVVEESENWEIAKATGNEFQMSRLRMLMPRRVGIISSHISQ